MTAGDQDQEREQNPDGKVHSRNVVLLASPPRNLEAGLFPSPIFHLRLGLALGPFRA